MAATIKFDNTEIRDLTHVPRFVKHESVAERQLTTLPLAREDGEVLITSKYGVKKIILQGFLTASTQVLLETAIDTFKELLSRPEKNLDVDWISGTLRFVATCTKHDFDRDFFHLLFVPWTAEFTVLTGMGIDTAETVARNDQVLTVTTPATDAFDLLGSKPPRVRITLTGDTFWPTNVRGIEYKNTDTGEKLVYTRNKTWSAGVSSKLVIDCILKKVTDNFASAIYSEWSFFGVFPRFKIGTNNILLTVGGIVNQETTENGAFTYIGSAYVIDATTTYLAQSFSIPYIDDTFKGITWIMNKDGAPGTLTWRIETDNGGKPSGSLVTANATGTLTAADVTIYTAYVTKYSANLWGLSANTKYWLVIRAAGVSGGNDYCWSIIPDTAGLFKQYQRGNLMVSWDSGASWTATMGTQSFGFKILYGGEPGTGTIKHKVEYTKNYL